MSKRRKKAVVSLKISQNGREIERTLRDRESLTAGKSPNNDIVLYGDSFPRSMQVLRCSSSGCTLQFDANMRGQVNYRDARLDLQTLLVHELLPARSGYYQLPIRHGRNGLIHVGDATVQFHVNGRAQAAPAEPSYSWTKATGKALTRDVLFKSIFVLFFAFEILFALFLRGYELPPIEPPELAQVPKRFARFVVQQQAETPESAMALTTGGADGAQKEEKEGDEEGAEQQRQGRPRRGGAGGGSAEQSVAEQGLLALIGGSGEASQSGGAADFLIDQGLVQELDNLLGQTPLRKGSGYGRGTGSGVGDGQEEGDGIEDLMDIGLSGGIDDLIGDVQGVESVQLQKRGNVNIQAPGRIRGSESARGYRTAESVMSVINSQQGRVMYTYNKYLRTDPTLGGKISLDVTIQADGRVAKVDVIDTTISNRDFIRELIAILRRLRFDTIPEGSLTVNVPFVFNRVE
ncbi:AgmX/PglI C-terminal domain-containing protein [candidate division KSB1 bacterium]|nr:AgmX/PglI C-terminal domain-containing protein [candidate division KSB1 bacterium]